MYVAALELGEANVQRISAKSGVKRTTVYGMLTFLKERGLLSETKKGAKTYYYAENPKAIEEHIDEQKQALKKLLPELLSVANLIERKPVIRYYDGVEGIKEVYKDTLKYPDLELLAWATAEVADSFDRDFFDWYYVPKRVEKKIWARVIASDTPRAWEYRGMDRNSLRTMKLTASDAYSFDAEINLTAEEKSR